MNLQVIADFTVIDESSDWLVVDKPAPLIVHPANRQPEPTLLGGVEILLVYEMENGARPAIVNRLDRETSGVVLIAKHAAAARELGMKFERREPAKRYLSLVHGWPDRDEWVCEAPIARAGEVGPSNIWVRQVVHPQGRPCRTRFEVAERFLREERPFALVRCYPETGRMHQLRVHLAHGGHPILGDKLYSGDGSEYLEWMKEGWSEALAAKLGFPRQALHAERLGLEWEGRAVCWEAALPADFAAFVEGRRLLEPPGVVIWNRDR